MIDIVKTLFGKRKGKASESQASPHDIAVAACALLLEMSRIDEDFSTVEQDRIIAIAKNMFDVSDEEATALIEAADRELKDSLDLWQFTTLINGRYGTEEKERIVELVWQIAYSDGHLHAQEDFLVHKLANLLHLTHRQLIDAKIKVMGEMGISAGSR